MSPFTERVIKLIKSIPSGQVMTYGQIAKLAGSPRGARQVVRILHSMSQKHNLPWHRVINSKGQIPFPEQQSLLEMEGIKIDKKNQINLQQYLYDPDDSPDTYL